MYDTGADTFGRIKGGRFCLVGRLSMVAALYAERLASLSLKLREINSAREPLLAQIADLEETSRAVQHEYNIILNKASAIATLPNEIIASILEETRGLELLVSQVTHRWRDVAIDSPKLWSNIQVNLAKEQAVNLSALYLTRSKGFPFNLTIVNNIGGINEHVALFGQMLADHIAHCRHLTIDYSSRDCNILLDFLIPVAAPLLESLDMTYCDYRPHDNSLGPGPRMADILRGGAPVLASVHLSQMPCCLPPLGSVTTLRLLELRPDSGIIGNKWHDVLVSLTRLTSLEVEGEIMASWIQGAAITLPALRTLRICATGDQEVAREFQRLYEAIDAPSLEFLELNGFINPDLEFFDSLWPLGANKYPALHTLSLTQYREPGAVSSRTHFAPIMLAFPQVQTVIFNERGQGEACSILRLLLKSDTGGLYWPVLNNVAFPALQSVEGDDIDNLLHQCLTSRISTGHPIGTLSFSSSCVSTLRLKGALSENGGRISPPPWMDLVKVAEYEKSEA
ncbi:hypothetical protein FIBSPDRAFT_893618 [Athelia psychrophila]|uniref:Uncharacterized protein n=1 Tax=Athelia psychrophila TaxID=1759441 RepID=A0A166GXX8_9AGAM|nr:hypothetical protein FIBSPDRAFT_893618 [Fibularhizoctonia sp. CBS 109695]